MNKKIFKLMSLVEDSICCGLVAVGMAMICLNLTPNMPLYGLIMMLIGLFDAIDIKE